VRALTVVAVVLAAWAGVVHAHHSNGMFDASAPLWVKGTVVSYAPVSPHAMLELEQRTADGKVQRWSVEGPAPGRLQRILRANQMAADAPVVKPGDVIEVCGFDLKAELRAKGPPESVAAGSKFMHAPLIVMPDGHRQSWGPYGKLDNCVRPNDGADAWREFLHRDTLARDLWCNGRANTKAASVAPKALVDEIARSMAEPCG
jgi:hypothetical protein